jgi:GMC oxidoreductase
VGGGFRLKGRARAALDAICDTFAPGGDGLPSATELGVPEALLALVGRNPRAAERRQVGQLLGLSFSPWRGGRAHADLMQAMPYTGGLGVLLRDQGIGEVRTGRDGRPIVRYVPGLYVCDGAAFPTASGVNPMVTIEALAHMNARGIAAKLS